MSIILSIVLSFLCSYGAGWIMIPLFQRMKLKQQVREEGPQHHQTKNGTPTMGGMMIGIAFVICWIFFQPQIPHIFIFFIFAMGFGFIGLMDDGLKVFFQRNLGLTAKQKLWGQLIVVFLAMGVMWRFHYVPEFLWHGHLVYILGMVVFFLFLLFFSIGFTNAVNLTDGLDGLVGGMAALLFSADAIIAFWQNQPGVAWIGIVLAVATFGFLLHNRHPAKIFMGDTGAFFIGGALVGFSIVTHTELQFMIMGFIFVCEALSVMAQVFYFKKTKKRLLKMSPFHHHLELSGWSEWKIVLVFWASTLGLIGLSFVI